MQKSTLIMAAVGIWVGAGVIFLVWFLGGDAESGPAAAPVAQQPGGSATLADAAPATSTAAPSASATDGTSITAASLPSTSSQTPPLDGGTISVEVPNGWKAMSRSSKYILGMSKPNLALPLIFVRKADAYQELEDLTAENARSLAVAIHKRLNDEKALTDPVTPVVIHRRSGDSIQVLRFARKAKQSDVVIKVFTLLYARDGKKYEIELQTRDDMLEEAASAAYAVAASIEPTGATDFGGAFGAPAAEEAAESAEE